MTNEELTPFIERLNTAEHVLTLARAAFEMAEQEHIAAHDELTVALDQLETT